VATLLVIAIAAAAGAETVATVGTRTITSAELEAHVKPRLVEIENARYEALREGLDEMVSEELIRQEAVARGTTPQALRQQEVDARVAEPGDADIQKVYDENKDRLGGQTLEQVKPQIVEYLKQEKEAERYDAFVTELKGKYKTTVALKAPVIKVETAGRPEKGGGASAPVTIIEFSDYECPFCQRAEGAVDQVMKAYGDKVRLVFRDFPLPMHPHARLAAEAAKCANAQGKFWPYHALLFANQRALGEDKLKEYAAQVGLDGPEFAKCLSEKKFKAAVDQDVADGAAAGVTGTPAFFINGRMLSGAQPFEQFKKVIDEELAAKGS
jgi:protein-disulfide isomerase